MLNILPMVTSPARAIMNNILPVMTSPPSPINILSMTNQANLPKTINHPMLSSFLAPNWLLTQRKTR
ncbi:hypothetical protein CUMW_024410 [Citrus unshiu]|nr:hypothetical protein CUMW_024410 [Citrus unshiu]